MIALLLAWACCFVPVGMGYMLWQRLDGTDPARLKRWYLPWVLKGLGFPVLAWLALNSGLLPGLPPLMVPTTAQMPWGSWDWLTRLARSSAAVSLVIATYWLAVTCGWLAVEVVIHSRQRKDMLLAAGLWSVLLAPVALVLFFSTGWGGAGLAAAVWLGPVTHVLLREQPSPPPPPAYSRAIASMKFGKFTEAEWEIIRQLETAENDFAGWMMLAELYAKHFHDLASAEQAVLDLCLQPNPNPSEVGVALNRLADWQLELGNDPVAARRTLQFICDLFPDLHVSLMARQRINLLPATREELLEQRQGKRIRLPALRANPEAEPDEPTTSRDQAIARANQRVEKLRLNPDDVPAREDLARIFAEDLGKIDPAIEQVELLLGMPNQPAAKVAEWLQLLAGWHLRFRRDETTGRQLLEQLVREHPESPQAFAAQRHLMVMNLEDKFRQARTGQTPPRTELRN